MNEVNASELFLFYAFETRPQFFDESCYTFVNHEAL